MRSREASAADPADVPSGQGGGSKPRTRGHKRPQVSFARLLEIRSWSGPALRRVIHRMEKDGMVRTRGDQVVLTQAGYIEAARLTRQHRLWELYLLEHADVAPARVDRDADAIEHVLEPEIVDELERLLDQQPMAVAVPSNPHEVEEA